LPYSIETYGLYGLHGRVVPLSIGIKLANQGLTVIGIGGDGGVYGEGMNHLIHAARRNHDVTIIINDNKVYGLTKGQTSPTSDLNTISGATPEGSIDNPLNPLLIALSAGATFVGRGFVGKNKQLVEMIKAAIEHKGFSLIDVLSPCVSFNKANTIPWYNERVYDLQDEGMVLNNFDTAFKKLTEWGDHIPTGIFYQSEQASNEELSNQINLQTSEVNIEQLINKFS
jgi:2-oxoglutarate ferredoxin oxidoreductase subunit beta